MLAVTSPFIGLARSAKPLATTATSAASRHHQTVCSASRRCVPPLLASWTTSCYPPFPSAFTSPPLSASRNLHTSAHPFSAKRQSRTFFPLFVVNVDPFARSRQPNAAPSRSFFGSKLPPARSAASAAPDDVAAQLKLFQLLAQEGEHKELADRWEELTGIWAAAGTNTADGVTPTLAPAPTSAPLPLSTAVLEDDECFRLYLKALSSITISNADPERVATAYTKIGLAPVARAARIDAVTAVPAPGPTATVSEMSATSPAATHSATLATPSTVASPAPSSSTAPLAAPSPTATPASVPLSPGNLISALFSGANPRSQGGDAKVLSLGSFKSWPTASPTGSGPEPIRVIIEEAKVPLWFRLGKFVLVTALYSFLILSFLSLLLDSSGILRATTQTTPFAPSSAPDANNAGGRGTTFKDVHGVEEAKAELYEVVEFLKDPERFSKLGGRLPRGVLLTGPPGTGKTLLARAVAGEAGVNFFSASGSEFDEMYVGVGARRIRELFAAARKAAPSIIFLDEIDAIGGKRSPRDQMHVKQTLNQLLVELDGFTPGEGVILIGATNTPETLDKALIRPGRFDRHVVVPLPDVRGRMQILAHHMRNVGYDKSGVDIATLARGTIGFSGADLQALVNQAAVKASADNASAVRAFHFEWAKERIMMGAARKSAYVTEKDKLATAYHEGGHALVALYTPGAYPLQSVTVVPRGMALGYTLMLPEMDKSSHSLYEYRAKLDVAMGGRVAEELVYGRDNVTDGASSDISNATSMANNMVRRFGFSDAVGPVSHSGDVEYISPQTQAVIESEVRSLIEAAQTRAAELLRSKKVELDRLANALVEHETLDLVEVRKVIRGEKITKTLEA